MLKQAFLFSFIIVLIFITGSSYELSLIISIELIIWLVFINFQIKRNNILFLVFGFCFFLKYVFIPIVINLEFITTNSFFSYSTDSLVYSVLVATIFLISFFIGQLLTGKTKREDIILTYNTLSSYSQNLLTSLILIGIVISFNITAVLQSTDNRIGAAQGTGYLFFLGYSGYFLIGNYINKNISNKGNIYITCLIALVCGLFFLFRFHRGGFLYPLCFVIITYTGIKYGIKKVFWTSILLVPLLFEINIISSALRTEFLTGTLIWESVVDRILNLHQQVTIPLAFGHIELLSKIIDSNLPREYVSTFFSSIFNWLPRILFDKSLTTGPTLALIMFPETRTFDGGHNSSLTTGLLVEFYYNFKYLFFVPAFLLGFIYQKSYYLILKAKNLSFLIVFIWLFGFIIFFDDLGGWVTKAFFCTFLGLLIYFTNRLGLNEKYKFF